MADVSIAARYTQPIAEVFAALVQELGEERWLAGSESNRSGALPMAGLCFGYRHARRFYAGEVLECLRPVSIVLAERYQGPAGAIGLRQRWGIEPGLEHSCLRVQLRIEPNRFARLQLKFWRAHFHSRALRTCRRIGLRLGSSHGSTTSIGHSIGNISIVNAKTTSVNGRPIRR